MLASVILRLASVVGAGSVVESADDATPAAGSTDADARDDALENRLRRARRTAGIDETTDVVNADATAFDISATDLADCCAEDGSISDQLLAKQARNRSKVRRRSLDRDRARRVVTTARQHAGTGGAPSSYAASFVPLFDAAIERAFDAVREGTSPEEAEADLRATMQAAMVDLQVGVDEFVETDSVEPVSEDVYGAVPTVRDVLESIPYSAFLIDEENTVLEYNSKISTQLGLDRDHREFIGKDCRETIAAATYTDNSRHNTLADKLVETPRNPDRHWEIERRDDDFEFTDEPVYGDTSVSVNTRGEEVHIDFLAVPFFDDDDDLLSVLELIEDRSADVRHQQAIDDLVTDISETLDRMGDGNLSARVAFEDEHGVISDELLGVTDAVNEMADRFESLVGRVERKTSALSTSIERATQSAHSIDEAVDGQRESLENVGTEMESFSAAMEEVAASSNEVADAVDSALENVETGVQSSEDARKMTDEVRAISDQLVDSVTELEEYMAEIGDVVEIISDVADQTNILALNANIEAARVDAGGDGFAVVADEVKSLATETREHTAEIETLIETIQEQTDETVSDVQRTHEQIEATDEQIERALSALQEVSERVEDAAGGVQEVAEANDEQAATVEEVTATVDTARESARDVASRTDEIVEETETQSTAIDELSEQVARLTASEEDRADEIERRTAAEADDTTESEWETIGDGGTAASEWVWGTDDA